MSKFIIASLMCGSLLLAQSGKQVVPPSSVHQYSAISPLSANNDKLHTFDIQGHARIVNFKDARVIADPAPYPEAHWDNTDDDLMYVIGGQTSSKPAIQTWRPSTRRYATYIDYKGRFKSITTGSTTDITYDDWEAFLAPSEHQVCAADLKAKKTYCLDYNAPDPLNKMGETKDVDYVAVTPRDSKSGLHYVLMLANPAMAVFSVDETAGRLRWIVRPEAVVPWMGSGKGNNDGNCDQGEACLTTPHGDVFVAPDGQVYFEMQVGMEIHTATQNACESGQGLLRLNAGSKMTTPESAFGVTGGGMKYFTDYPCGVQWSSQHTGCARWGQICVVSYASPPVPPASNLVIPRWEDIWLIDLKGEKRIGNANSSYDYWSQARAAMSMDGTLVVYDSDHATHGASHAVYALPSGLPPVPQPSLTRAPADRPR